MRGRFGYQLYLDSKRAKTPMVRKNGQLVEATWEEAFAAIEKGLQRVREDFKPEEILVSASPKICDEHLYLAARFARAALGTNNLVSFHHLASGADYHALDDMLGATVATISAEDLEQADLYLFLGGNPSSETPVPAWQMKRRMRHGVPSIVINSRDVDIASHATVIADPRRGTATKLINGVIAELLRRGQIDEEFIKAQTVNFEALRSNLINLELSEVCAVTGVTEEQIRAIADLLSNRSKKVVAWYNLDSRIDRGPDDLKALTTLLLLLGKVGVPGSGLALFSGQCNHMGMRLSGFDAQLLPGGANASDAKHAARVAELWRADVRNMDGKPASRIEKDLCEGKIRAAFIIGENPAALDRFNGPINNLDFLVVGDLFVSETAHAADVFLPMPSNFETEGHLTNWCGVSQPIHAVGDPVNGMMSLEVWKTLLELAGHPIASVNLEDLGKELDHLKQEAGYQERLKDSFLTPDGKARFKLYSDRVRTYNALKTSVLTTYKAQVLPLPSFAALKDAP